MGDAPPATPSAALPVATPVELQPPQPPTQTEEQQQQQPQEEEQQQQPTEEQRNSRAVEAAEPSGAGLSNGTAADVSEQSVPDSPVVPSQLQMHDDESSSTMMSAPPSRIKVKALFDFDGVQVHHRTGLARAWVVLVRGVMTLGGTMTVPLSCVRTHAQCAPSGRRPTFQRGRNF